MQGPGSKNSASGRTHIKLGGERLSRKTEGFSNEKFRTSLTQKRDILQRKGDAVLTEKDDSEEKKEPITQGMCLWYR